MNLILFYRGLKEEIDVAEDELRLAQQENRDIKGKVKINWNEFSQVEKQVRSLKARLHELVSEKEEVKESIVEVNDDTINAYVSGLIIVMKT